MEKLTCAVFHVLSRSLNNVRRWGFPICVNGVVVVVVVIVVYIRCWVFTLLLSFNAVQLMSLGSRNISLTETRKIIVGLTRKVENFHGHVHFNLQDVNLDLHYL